MAETQFVKSKNTEVPASRSQGELERILRRYGASGFGVQSDYASGIVRVFFRVPDAPKQPAHIPVRLEISITAVAEVMFGKPGKKWERGRYVEHPTEDELAQAERVAWRHLVLWVDAALSAATAGVQKLSEAFLAHTLVRGSEGQVLRVVEQMDLAAGGNWRALLAPPSSERSE